MTIRLTGYETTIGSAFVTKQIEHALKEAFIKDLLQTRSLDLINTLDVKPVFVTGRFPSESSIPFFAHPLVIKNVKGNDYLCMDVRPFVRQDDDNVEYNDVSVRNTTEYNFVKSRMILNLAWLTGAGKQIQLNFGFAGTVFAAWLSEVIGKRFALDPKDQMEVFIITHFYYQSLFCPEKEFEEDMLQKFALHTIKASKMSSQMVFDLFDKIKSMGSLEDYCENVKTIVENIRLKDLNPGLIITLVGNSWFGLNAKEILAVALEHPPTWAAIVYACCSERSYKKSMIGQVCDRYGKNNVANDYLKSYVDLVENYILPKDSALVFDSFN